MIPIDYSQHPPDVLTRDIILAHTDVIVIDTDQTPPRLFRVLPAPAIQCDCRGCSRRLGQALGMDWVPLQLDLNGLFHERPYITVDATALLPETLDRLVAFLAEEGDDVPLALDAARDAARDWALAGYRMATRPDHLALVRPSMAKRLGL